MFFRRSSFAAWSTPSICAARTAKSSIPPPGHVLPEGPTTPGRLLPLCCFLTAESLPTLLARNPRSGDTSFRSKILASISAASHGISRSRTPVVVSRSVTARSRGTSVSPSAGSPFGGDIQRTISAATTTRVSSTFSRVSSARWSASRSALSVRADAFASAAITSGRPHEQSAEYTASTLATSSPDVRP